MSIVRDSLIGLLAQGPAYGLQLRNELDRRLRREPSINVGQVYSTLDRLVAQGLVTQAAKTPDGLPLYDLTPAGHEAYREWLAHAQPSTTDPFDAMVRHVMMVRSLPGVDSTALLDSYRAHWNAQLAAAQELFGHSAGEQLRSDAAEELALASIRWLDRAANTDDTGFAISLERPRRGRPRV